MRHILNEDTTVDKFVEYAVNVWKITPSADNFATANAGIDATEAFFKRSQYSTDVQRKSISTDSKFEVMAQRAIQLGNLEKSYVPLSVRTM
jgi:butanol dehydrogenase